MNGGEVTINQLISIITILVSIYSLHVSNETKKEQQKLEREMQNNEFNFSVKRIWYEKQNLIIDLSIVKLVENLDHLNKLHKSYDENTERALAIDNLLDEIEKTDEEIINKEVETWTDDESDEKIEKLIKNHIELNHKKRISEELELMLKIYENLLYLKSHRHYFPKNLDNRVQKINSLVTKSLNIKSKETNARESKIISKSLLKEINSTTDYIRNEFLYN